MTAKIGNNLILRKKSIYKHQELASFADIKKTELRALMAFDTVAYGNDGVEVVIICRLGRKIGNSDFSLLHPQPVLPL